MYLIYLLYLLYFAIAVTVALSLLLYTYQCELLYASGFPTGSRSVVARPSQFGLPDKEVILVTKDGYKIRSYVMIQRGEDVAIQSPTVVCFHAHTGNMVNFGVFIFSGKINRGGGKQVFINH
ncbi:uncharacterized protein EV154DRAFT_299716 [Mucor mucedo]|uniref:uncharacterized protein n=1 Tax=Mucor mucedo TaxID=29922 RepID=UPI00221EFE8E|nr:uncharacterized protein EV154DRAFT_299716 [Mucor mucedo]KAI7895946.1 hypothetical protein EV154DRAFT_299716 [Mucor mucedo]